MHDAEFWVLGTGLDGDTTGLFWSCCAGDGWDGWDEWDVPISSGGDGIISA